MSNSEATTTKPPLWEWFKNPLTIFVALPAAIVACISIYTWLSGPPTKLKSTASGYPFYLPKEITASDLITTDMLNADMLSEISAMRRYVVVNVTNVGTSPTESVAVQLNTSKCVFVVEQLDTFTKPEVGKDRIDLGTIGQDTFRTVHIWYNAPPERPNSLSVVHATGKETIGLEASKSRPVSDYFPIAVMGISTAIVTIVAVYRVVGRRFEEATLRRALDLQRLSLEVQQRIEPPQGGPDQGRDGQ